LVSSGGIREDVILILQGINCNGKSEKPCEFSTTIEVLALEEEGGK